jgi:hypothetical protein
MLANTRARRAAGLPHNNPFPSDATAGWRPTYAYSPDPVPDILLDPFNGSGKTGRFATEHGRQYVGIELNPEHLQPTRQRLAIRARDTARAKNRDAGSPNGPHHQRCRLTSGQAIAVFS